MPAPRPEAGADGMPRCRVPRRARDPPTRPARDPARRKGQLVTITN